MYTAGEPNTAGAADGVRARPCVRDLTRVCQALRLNPKTWSQVSCGARHTALLTHCGKVFTCGNAQFGQLGLGDTQLRTTPTQACNLSPLCVNLRIVPGTTGDSHGRGDARLECAVLWKIPSTKYRSFWSSVQVPVPGSHVVDAVCGWWHTLFLATVRPAEPLQSPSGDMNG